MTTSTAPTSSAQCNGQILGPAESSSSTGYQRLAQPLAGIVMFSLNSRWDSVFYLEGSPKAAIHDPINIEITRYPHQPWGIQQVGYEW